MPMLLIFAATVFFDYKNFLLHSAFKPKTGQKHLFIQSKNEKRLFIHCENTLVKTNKAEFMPLQKTGTLTKMGLTESV